MKIRILSRCKRKWPKILQRIVWQSQNSGIRIFSRQKSIALFLSFKTGKIRFHIGSNKIA